MSCQSENTLSSLSHLWDCFFPAQTKISVDSFYMTESTEKKMAKTWLLIYRN
uniref:Uncharacterized protein n=1 Tax=Nelumbo nucifera TaxID=4432 RepID=A0A822Y1T7_NELNU|nr:TPA_asm: hypothetical protein HUJ06_026723 [Nelumbo nucifera]